MLLVLSFIFLTTIPANAQTGNVNLKLKNVTLPRLFQEIEKQSTYRFSYRDADLVGKAPVTVSVKERSLKSVLTDILSKRNLQYQVSGNKNFDNCFLLCKLRNRQEKKKLAELLLMKEANLLSVSIFRERND